jgi:hypothetical protein
MEKKTMTKKTKRQMIESLVSLRQPDDRKLEVYSELFAPQMEALAKSPRAKISGITDEDRLALGECLTNYMLESNNQANMGLDPVLAISVITSVFGNSVLPLFTSEQPIQDKQGVIYFENIVAKSNRGNVTAGQILAGGARAKEVYPVGYAADGIYDIALGSGDGAAKEFTLNFNATKIRPNYVAVKVGDVVITDDGKGNLIGAGAYGTVDYAAGTGSLVFKTAPESGVAILGYVATDFEADGSTIGKLNVEYDSKIVKAHTFALQADTSILASFISKKRLGVDANKRAVEVLQQQILREITNDAIAKIGTAVNADALKTTQFNLSHPQAISVQAHLNSYNLTHSKVQSKMAEYSGKGNFGAMIAGTEFCEFLTGLNEFKQEGVITDDPTYFGTLGGRYGNVKVVRAPQMPTADKAAAYCVYQNSKVDAAAVFAPFMPVMVTNDIPVSDNLLQRRSLIASMATTEVVVDRYLQKVSLTGDPYTTQG